MWRDAVPFAAKLDACLNMGGQACVKEAIHVPKRQTGPVKTSVAWGTAIVAVAVLPAVFVPVPALRDFFYLPKVLLLFGLELAITALLLLRVAAGALGRRSGSAAGSPPAAAGASAAAGGLRGDARNPLLAPILAYWAILAVSTWLSIDPLRSLLGAPLRWEGFITFLLYGGLVLLLPLVARVEGPLTGSPAREGQRAGRVAARVDQLLRWGMVVAMLIVAYGLVQRYGLDPAPRDAIRPRASWWGTSAFSTLGNANFFGSFTAMYLALAAGRYLSAPKGDRGTGFWLAGAGVAYYGLLTSLSRGAWLAAGAALAVAVAAMALARMGLPLRRLASLALLVAVLTVGWRLADPMAGRRVADFVQDTSQQTGTVGQRLWIWRGTLGAVAARPWFGWGLESLGRVFPQFEPPGRQAAGLTGLIIDRAHNDYLQVAVSSGVLGLAAYLWLLLRAAGAAWRGLRSNGTSPLQRSLLLALTAAAAAHLLAMGMNLSTVSESPSFWGFLGLIATLSTIWGEGTRDMIE